MLFLPIIIFVFGLLIGSFLNVVVLRINTGRSMVTGRSKCARCSRTLAWYELIPVVSFLVQRGKCRSCKTDISFQYPFVELSTAIVFVSLYAKIVLLGAGISALGIASFLFGATVASILIVITVYDLRHKIIPDILVYLFIILALVGIVFKSVTLPGFLPGVALANGVLVALPFFLFWFLSRGTLMGFGDVKLALGIGWLVSVGTALAALLLSFWFGGIVGIFLLAGARGYSMKSEIPFAPFLIIGLAGAVFFNITIQTLFPLWS